MNGDGDVVESRNVKMPSGVAKIYDDVFQVSENAVIYSLISEIVFRNVGAAERFIKIDGVTV